MLYFEQLTQSGPLYFCLVYVLILHWCNAGIHWIRCTLSLWDQFVQINVFILFPDGSTCQHIYTWIQRLCQALSCSHDDSFSWPQTLKANNPNPLPKLNYYPKVKDKTNPTITINTINSILVILAAPRWKKQIIMKNFNKCY